MRFYGRASYALECVALKQITFLHSEKLNDPFDPVLDYVTDFDDDYRALLTYVQKYRPKQLGCFKKRLPRPQWEDVVKNWATLANELREEMFIFSACAVLEGKHPRDNLYMWGHYGNGHRGVAIEFDATALGESLIEQPAPDSQSPWWEMNYTKKIPKIKCEDVVEFVLNATPGTNNLGSYGPQLTEVILQRLRAKGTIWKRENEWRLVQKNSGTRMKFYRHALPDNAITAVYLGCRASEKEQIRNDFVYETQRNFPNASVFWAKGRKDEYALDFEPL